MNSITKPDQKEFTRFRRALRRDDQVALDELLNNGHHHLAAKVLPDAMPSEVLLLSMVLEQQKIIQDLREGIEKLECSSTKP